MIQRREFITLLGGAAVVWPLAAPAQQPAMPVVGFLRDSPAEGFGHFVAALRKGLSETGFVEGQNILIEFGWSDGHSDRLPTLAANFVRRPVSVIVASAIGATLAAKAATSTLPIVFAIANDPVAFGLVSSLSRPGSLRRYAEILASLDPAAIHDRLLAFGGTPVMLCFEGAADVHAGRCYCHRHLAAQWLEDRLGIEVQEVGHPQLDRFALLRALGIEPPRFRNECPASRARA
jgi:hypothetical protein